MSIERFIFQDRLMRMKFRARGVTTMTAQQFNDAQLKELQKMGSNQNALSGEVRLITAFCEQVERRLRVLEGKE